MPNLCRSGKDHKKMPFVRLHHHEDGSPCIEIGGSIGDIKVLFHTLLTSAIQEDEKVALGLAASMKGVAESFSCLKKGQACHSAGEIELALEWMRRGVDTVKKVSEEFINQNQI